MGSLLPTAQCHIAVVSSGYKVMTRLCLLQSHCNHVSMHPHLSSEPGGRDQCELAGLAMSVTASYRTQGQILDCSAESGHLASPKVRGSEADQQIPGEGRRWGMARPVPRQPESYETTSVCMERQHREDQAWACPLDTVTSPLLSRAKSKPSSSSSSRLGVCERKWQRNLPWA